MLDALIELIPVLRNSLLNDREKRQIMIAVLITLPITIFLISFKIAYTVIETNNQKQQEELSVEQINPTPALQRSVKYSKTEKDALYLLLSKTFKEGNFAYSEEIAQDLMTNDSTDNFAQYFSAKMKIENKKYTEANEILQKLQAKNYMPDSLKTLFISVVSLNELPALIGDTNSLLPVHLAKIGERYLPTDEKAAKIFFMKALEKDSSNVEALYQSARWYMINKDYKTTETLMLRLLKIDASSARVLGRYAMLLHETGRKESALAYYKKAIEKNPYDFNLAFNLGELYFSLFNDNANARIYFQKAIDLSPSVWQSYFKLALICVEENKLDEAINYFTVANEYSAANPRILHLFAAAYEKKGDFENARRIYNQILAINPLDDIAIYKSKLLKQR